MITFYSSLLSGIVAAIITLIVTSKMQKRSDKREYKLQVFKDLIAYRSDITDTGVFTGNFEKAINQVFIAYNDSPEVITSFEAFRAATTAIHRDNNAIIGNLVSMLKAMANDLSIDYSFSNDDLFTRPIQIGRH